MMMKDTSGPCVAMVRASSAAMSVAPSSINVTTCRPTIAATLADPLGARSVETSPPSLARPRKLTQDHHKIVVIRLPAELARISACTSLSP